MTKPTFEEALTRLDEIEKLLSEKSPQEQSTELQEFLDEYSASDLEKVKEIWNNTERDYQEQIRELKSKGTGELSEENKEKLAEYDNLITERDELKRENITLNQEVTARGNNIRNKNKEVENKQKEIERLKKEKGELDKNLNKKITDKNKELDELKKKYSRQSQLLDTEQLECKKLEEKIERLEEENRKLLQEKHGSGYADF